MTKSEWKSFFDRDFLKNTLAALGGALSALLIYYLLTRLDKKKVSRLASEKDGRRMRYLGGLVQASQGQSLKEDKTNERPFYGLFFSSSVIEGKAIVQQNEEPCCLEANHAICLV